jgi:hypothetical protein
MEEGKNIEKALLRLEKSLFLYPKTDILTLRQILKDSIISQRDEKYLSNIILGLETKSIIKLLHIATLLYSYERDNILDKVFYLLGRKFKHTDIYMKITKHIEEEYFDDIFLGDIVRIDEYKKHRVRAGVYYILMDVDGEEIFFSLARHKQDYLRLEFVLSYEEEPDFYIIADKGRFLFSGEDIVYPFKFLYNLPKEIKYKCIYNLAKMKYTEIKEYFDNEFLPEIVNMFSSPYANFYDDLFLVSFGIRKERLLNLFKLLRTKLRNKNFKKVGEYFDELVLNACTIHKHELISFIKEDIITIPSLKEYILKLIEKREKEGDPSLIPIILWLKEQYEKITREKITFPKYQKTPTRTGLNMAILSPSERIKVEKALLLLGLTSSDVINWDVVLKAYRKSVRQYHPDAAKTSKYTSDFIKIKEAKEILERMRKKYKEKMFL